MTMRWSIRRWTSVADPTRRATELIPSPISPDQLPAALAFLAKTKPADTAFLVVRISADGEALRQAIEAANHAAFATRICVAVDAAEVATIDANTLDGTHVGLLLDEVDGETAMSTIASDAIEAIRFRADFVARASRHLRTGCVLESMLRLAKDLGLCTLGLSNGDPRLVSPPLFDYVSDLPQARLAERGRLRRDLPHTSRSPAHISR
ncbi:MAG: hypothetical protein ACXWCV_02440 [Caldimonas sp.]